MFCKVIPSQRFSLVVVFYNPTPFGAYATLNLGQAATCSWPLRAKRTSRRWNCESRAGPSTTPELPAGITILGFRAGMKSLRLSLERRPGSEG